MKDPTINLATMMLEHSKWQLKSIQLKCDVIVHRETITRVTTTYKFFFFERIQA